MPNRKYKCEKSITGMIVVFVVFIGAKLVARNVRKEIDK